MKYSKFVTCIVDFLRFAPIVNRQLSIVNCLLLIVVLVFAACRDNQWDEHGKTTVEGGDTDLLDAISKNTEISAFYDALVKTGYDQLLTSGVNYTVLAPTNAAWATVNMDDEESLLKTVANHIGYDKRMSNDEALYKELVLVSGKVLRYAENESFGIGGAQITDSRDHVAGNGVFHVLDKVIVLQLNIWEHIVDNLSEKYAQALFLKTEVDKDVIDLKRSVRTGVHPQTGAPIYDTVWMKQNSFLEKAPLNDEMQVFTYVVLEDNGFHYLHQKFRPFFRRTTDKGTDSLARSIVSLDMVFEGIVDIAAADTLVNMFGYKVALDGNVVGEPYQATNGRVYILSRSNIHFRERIRPVHIDSEEYTYANITGGNNPRFVPKHYRPWATGPNNTMLKHQNKYKQRDTIRDPLDGSIIKCRGLYYDSDSILHVIDADSTRTVDWYWGTNEINNWSADARKHNGYAEFKAELYSGEYEIRYRAYLSSADGEFRESNTTNPTMRKAIYYQKFFISMPDAPRLKHGNGGSRPPAASTRPADIASRPNQRDVWSPHTVENNFLGPDTAFVAMDTLDIDKERIMRKWRLIFTDTYIRPNTDPNQSGYATTRINLCQFVSHPVPEPESHILKVPRAGELTMWLTNTPKNEGHDTGNNWEMGKGILALDYLKLVPILPDED